MKIVHIMGAGPAGLSVAYHLDKSKYKVIVYDIGKPLEKRNCPMICDTVKTCCNCQYCNVLYGVGGAGLISDGKLEFNPQIGLNQGDLKVNVTDIINKLLPKWGGFFGAMKDYLRSHYEVNPPPFEWNSTGATIIDSRTSEYHVGTDLLPKVMGELVKTIKDQGCEFNCITTRIPKEIDRLIETKDNIVVLATGRSGWRYANDIINQYGNVIQAPIDIGVRVETSCEVWAPIYDKGFHDFKAKLPLSNDDQIRTFCVCPKGFVGIENHNEFNLVNGYSNSKFGIHSSNTNFAFLTKINTKETSGNEYGETIAKAINQLGMGQPIIQRLKDLKLRRRSTEDRIKCSNVKPTLKATPGDIGLGMPGRIINNLIEGFEKLDKIVPGINSDNTLLYAPEIKFHGLKVKHGGYLNVMDRLYVVGDVSGYSRGIVGAAVTGYIAAEHMNSK